MSELMEGHVDYRQWRIHLRLHPHPYYHVVLCVYHTHTMTMREAVRSMELMQKAIDWCAKMNGWK